MDYLSRIAERFSLWAAGGFVIFAAVWIWFLTGVDELTRRHVELQRQWWGSTSTFESEFKKVRSRARLVYSFFLVISLSCAMVIVCAHVLVR